MNKTLNLIFVAMLSCVVLGCGRIKSIRYDECGECRWTAKPPINSRAVSCPDSVMDAAACLTQFEEDLRRDGTVTIKTPDVWGDKNLMHWIQEFDNQLAGKVGGYQETIQAVSATFDGAKVEYSSVSGSVIPDPEKGSAVPGLDSLPAQATVDGTPFGILEKLTSTKATTGELKLEPTEKLRQEATYVYVNQALRRKNMGGDNTRQAGYGLYLFRIPISVLPGSDTTAGYAAVAHLRARMVVTPADVKYTLPRMAVADLVDLASEYVQRNWDAADDQPADELSELRKWFEDCCKEVAAYAPYSAPNDLVFAYVDFKSKLQDFHTRDRFSDNDTYGARVDELNAAAEGLRNTLGRTRCKPGDDQTNPPAELQSPPIVQNKNNQVLNFRPGQDKTAFAEPAIPSFPRSKPVSQTAATDVKGTGVPQIARSGIDQANLDAILFYLKHKYGRVLSDAPRLHEIRNILFEELIQVSIHLENVLAITGQPFLFPDNQGRLIPAIQLAASRIEQGCPDTEIQKAWEAAFRSAHCEGNSSADDAYVTTAWLVARQCGLVDLNIKRLLEELALTNKVSPDDVALANSINFFAEHDLQTTVALWQKIVDIKFPVQVFTLEPTVEEQNVVDAVSRLRDMQFALAYSVAQGGFGTAQRVAAARKLARDAAALGLNRTVVGFSHGDDTFGWYFYPRVQPPAIENSNLRAWSSTLTGRGTSVSDELKSRRIEPGMRECEVLIAMPNFISEIEFDTTTNWESLACPGKPKQSYQEMLDRGARFKKLRQCVNQVQCGEHYRPGDIERLQSRVEQLENMLHMQTHLVSVPYTYKQSAVDLFGQGDETLVPEIQGYYGLQFLAVNSPDSKSETPVTAQFFVTGKNFHPTQTHVVVGGHASQFNRTAEESKNRVEVLSRQLIKVSVDLKEARLSEGQFEVRVGTPNGLSNPLIIFSSQPAPVAKKSELDWKGSPHYSGYIASKDGKPDFILNGHFNLQLVARADVGFDPTELKANDFEIKCFCEIKFADGTKRSLDPVIATIELITKPNEKLQSKIVETINKNWYATDNPPATIVITTYIKLDKWPVIKCDTPIIIDVKPKATNAP